MKDMRNTPWNKNTKCEFVGGDLAGKVLTVGQLLKMGLVTGYDRVYDGAWVKPLTVLLGSPMVKGYVSAMWGSQEAPLRYESPEMNYVLSL